MIKFIVRSLFIVSIALMCTSQTFALETESNTKSGDDAARAHGITFPIPELGNCGNYDECRTYCADPFHKQICTEVLKKKQVKTGESEQKKNSTLERAKAVLGCTSADTCKTLCAKQENFDKCHQFATHEGVSGGYKENPTSQEFLKKAKDVLGCDSYEACKTYCQNSTHHDACSRFAKSVNAKGGYETKGPGGCTTKDTCRTYCTDTSHSQECAAILPKLAPHPTATQIQGSVHGISTAANALSTIIRFFQDTLFGR